MSHFKMAVFLTALGIGISVFQGTKKALKPAKQYYSQITMDKKVNAQNLERELHIKSSDSKYSAYINRISSQSGGSVLGYYKISYKNTTSYIAIYVNGDISVKDDDNEWEFYRSPDSLEKFYSRLKSKIVSIPEYKKTTFVNVLNNWIGE